MRQTVQDPKEGRFVVGVDFGTTFTSVTFAHSVSPEEVKLVQSWGNGSADQVPTELKYMDAASRTYLCGYEIPPARRRDVTEPLKWFKLLLQNNADLLNTSPANTTPALKTFYQLHVLGIKAEKVAKDFLCSIRKSVLADLGKAYDTRFVKNSKVQYVITIPAIWSDAAKALMVKAAVNAGYGQHRKDFNLVSEPEAAAAYTLKVIQPHEFKQNDTFIICDAGGGTVDLISYKVKELQPLRIDEVVSGTGDLCGSVYLDEGFRAYLEGRLGSELLESMSQRSQTAMQKSWEEQVKFKFGTPAENRSTIFEVVVPGVPDNDDLDIEEGFHTMTDASVQKIFDPVVNKVIRLVRDQVEAVESAGHSVAAILLVGGFGCSPYLFHRLETAKFGAKVDKIQVIQPINARTSIARGALLRGLDGSIVTEKRARRSYGIECRIEEIPSDGFYRRVWDDIDNVFKISGYLNWSIKKNTVLANPSSVSLGFHRRVPVGAPNMVFSTQILASDQMPPPEWIWRKKTKVYTVCTLLADLTRIPTSQFKQVSDSVGVRFYHVNYDIKATMVDDVLKFELVHNGKSYGEVTTKFE